MADVVTLEMYWRRCEGNDASLSGGRTSAGVGGEWAASRGGVEVGLWKGDHMDEKLMSRVPPKARFSHAVFMQVAGSGTCQTWGKGGRKLGEDGGMWGRKGEGGRANATIAAPKAALGKHEGHQ